MIINYQKLAAVEQAKIRKLADDCKAYAPVVVGRRIKAGWEFTATTNREARSMRKMGWLVVGGF